jgi:hypothetical protein
LLKKLHEEKFHFSANQMVDYLRRQEPNGEFWYNMRDDARMFVRECEHCAAENSCM